MYFDSKNKNECSGCAACMNACPTAAITMQADEEGFLYPFVNDDSCIHCNLCRKVCSWEHPLYNNDPNPLTLASVLSDIEERQRSTSGGIFFAIAKWVLEKGGIVYGAAFDAQLQLHHIGVETIEDLQQLRGSKYIQSSIGSIFKDIKQQLDSGRWCYFTGTGCQVAGLYAYLRKDYSQLITSDLVCHGVPCQKLFNDHVAYLESKYGDKVVNYKFRDYKRGGVGETVSFTHRNKIIKPSYELSPFLYSFMYAMTYRQSCYECRYAKVPRQGDTTLADYWGLEEYYPQFDTQNGVSLLLLNNNKGKCVWEQIKKDCDFQYSTVEDASKYNMNLIVPSQKPEIRNTVYNDIKKYGYAKIAETTFRSPNYFKVVLSQWAKSCSLFRPLVILWRYVRRLRKNEV